MADAVNATPADASSLAQRLPGSTTRRSYSSPEVTATTVVTGCRSNGVSVKRVLVAYDGSAPARRALAHAAELARSGDAVTVVNVMPEPGVGARIEPPTDERNRQWCLLDEAQRLLADRGIHARTMAPVGDAATEILAAAEVVRADLIVVARHRGHVPHPLGSITSRLVRSASCDVLVVHEASAEPGPDDQATTTPC